MNRLTDYISRIGHARGFGIQSPWAYNFVREVVGQTYLYYAYADIDAKCHSHRERQWQRLFYRIANFVHPAPTLHADITDGTDAILRRLPAATPHGAIIIHGIYDSKDAYEAWIQLRDSQHVGVSFDLRDCAVCFLDPSMHKQHYKLNF